jgi:hypothetical protein
MDPGWIGRPVKVQWDMLHVRILHPHTNQLLREHLRQKRGGYRIREEDHPKKMPLSTAQLLRRCEHAGTQIGKLCQLRYQRQGETGIRRILGVLSLMKNTERRRSKMPVPSLWTSASRNTASSAVIWSATHIRKWVCGRSIP